MRILSQENLYDMGNIDLPYEMCGLSMGYTGDKSKFFVFAHFQGADNKMAEYSSPEKARKVMEMLHEQYAKLYSLATLLQGGTELFAKSISQQEAECFATEYKNMNVFRFPSDDEAEV